MLRSKALFAVSCLAVVGMLVVGCAPVAAPTQVAKATTPPTQAPVPKAAATAPQATAPAPTPKPSADGPRDGGIVTRAFPRDVTSFDVQRESGADVSLSLFNVYQGLVRLDPIGHQKIMPELAESWEASPDGKAVTFKLFKGVKWHDGKSLTVEDVKYSLDRMHNPKEFKTVSPRGEGLLKSMDRAEIVDQSTIKVTLKYPSASFLPNIATGWVAVEPKHILDAKGDMRRDLVGTGPFKFKEFNPGVSLELAKNPDYHLKGLPHLDGIKFFTIKDDATRFASFRTGTVKITFTGIYGLAPALAEQVKREMADKVVVYDHDSQTRQTIVYNITRKPFDDVRVRKAVDLAFDRQAAVKVNGRGYVGSIYVAPWGTKPEDMSKLPGYRQPKDPDIAEAKKLMAEAGFPNGFKTTLLSPSGGFAERQVVVAKDQLAKLGIDVEVQVVEYATFWERARRQGFDLISATRTDNTSDPDEPLYTYYATTGDNWGRFSDKEIDELIEKQARTIDVKARQAILSDIEKRLLDKVPISLVFWDVFQLGAWKEVRNFSPGPGIHPWGKLDQVWLAR
ncbi:MAG: ABC transporter substrate-binding protein [Chloroflexi bacterium]|nr:ABC transporter substrate-binding protein [Chloroflexota bacterium]